MRILLLVDHLSSWSIHNRAKAIKKNIPDWHFDIKAVDSVDVDALRELHYKYDIVHFCCGGYLLKYFSIFQRFPKTMTTTISSHGSVSGVFADYDKLEYVYKNSARVVALNRRLAECFGNCVYIPNGVDTGLFKPRKERKFVVGFVGIRTKAKGYHLARQACEELKEHVRFVDDGSDYPEKYMPHNQMPKFYHKIDALVMASEDEGSSNAVLEALACGKPVITTEVGNAPELCGVVTVERTVDGIKSGILELMPEVAIRKEWTWKQVAKKYRKMWAEIYNEVRDIKDFYYNRLEGVKNDGEKQNGEKG